MSDLLDEFHKKVVNAVGPGTPVTKPMSSGMLAKGLHEMGLPERIEVVKVNDAKKRRNAVDIRLFF